MSVDNCKKHYDQIIDYTVLCVQNDNFDQSACKGDSGGPLYDASQRRLVGVVSGGPSDCKGKPIRYSRVAAGVSFIKTLTFC